MKSTTLTTFFDTVAKCGDKVAVVDNPTLTADADGTQLCVTYNEFLKRARQVAHLLHVQGVEPQMFVTIELPACADCLVAELGVWLVHCAAVPVGPNFPAERKDYIRQHSGAVLNIDAAFMASITEATPEADAEVPDEKENALLVYTSGSTGLPKGILHDFKSLFNSLPDLLKRNNLSLDDSYAAAVPSYFIAANSYWLLAYGVEVHIMNPLMAKDIVRTAEYHRNCGITVAFISATVYPYYQCLAPTLRAVSTGSDRVISRTNPPYRLVNAYGLTETAGEVLETDVDGPTENAPIGRPIDGVECALLDDDLRPVAQGEEGEICLKGYFCKGYYKEEEMTRKLYRGGWLHTGDLGRELPDGRIQFVNRKDWMLKINGQRVEPGEVEAVMCEVEGVSRAVVKGFESDNGSHYMVGYYTANEGAEVAEREVRKHLEQRLPAYMVPTHLVPMESFSLNVNGKINRLVLQPPDVAKKRAEYVAPTNEAEATLCEIIGQVMGLDRVGIDDDFRQLGGNSIQMMRMQQLCKESKVDLLHGISTRDIYEGATPKRIVALLNAGKDLQKAEMDDYPLSTIQSGYFKMCMAMPNMPVLHVFGLAELIGEVDMAKLAGAIHTAVEAHPTFHTQFIVQPGGEVRQKVSVRPFEIAVEQMSAEAFEQEKKSLVQPLRLPDGPLFKFRLFEVMTPAEGREVKKRYLFFNVHHIIYDGVSHQILMRDIDRAYRGQAIEAEDWTAAQLAYDELRLKTTEAYAKAKEWYESHTGNHPVVRCPMNKAAVKMVRHKVAIDVPLDHAEQACRHYGVTMNALSSAAYMLMIGKYAGVEDVTLVTIYSGRDDSRMANTVGVFARSATVRGQWSATTTTGDYLSAVNGSLVEAIANSIYIGPQSAAGTDKRSNIYFFYHGSLMNDMRIGGAELKEVPFGEKFAPSSIDSKMFVSEERNAIELEFDYNPALFDESYVDRMTSNFTACMKGLVAGRSLGEIEVDVVPADRTVFVKIES